jgi:hypothetical protein
MHNRPSEHGETAYRQKGLEPIPFGNGSFNRWSKTANLSHTSDGCSSSFAELGAPRGKGQLRYSINSGGESVSWQSPGWDNCTLALLSAPA